MPVYAMSKNIENFKTKIVVRLQTFLGRLVRNFQFIECMLINYVMHFANIVGYGA